MSLVARVVPADTPPAPTRPTVARGRPLTFGYIPALDGLRAVAVLTVMAYHGGASFMPGGFLSIDIFFVLSGFLITSLLVGEWGSRATIRLGQFWTRRARRLLPALLVLLVGVAIGSKLVASPDEFANLRLDSLSTLFYVANWHFIVSGSNYFNQTGQPSPLSHMWSLSIEEQFYLVWPLVVLLMLSLGRRLRSSRRLWPLLGAAVVGAVASAVDMALRYDGPASVMRVYEGTDTRAQDLLVGAALAVAMAMWAQYRRTRPEDALPPHGATGAGPRPIPAWTIGSRGVRLAVQVAAWATVAVMAYVWSHLSLPGPFLYDGGYLLLAAGLAVVLFCAVTDQAGALGRALAVRPLRFVGMISYGAYLWHFPLFIVLSASRMHLGGLPLLAVRIAVTLVVATASFYLVERPVRQSRMRSFTEWRAWLATAAAFLGVVAVTVVATVPSAADAAPASAVPVPSGPLYSGPLVRVDLFGDSLAFTLGASVDLAKVEPSYDAKLIGGAILGCGVVRSTETFQKGEVAGTTPPCNPTSPTDQQWPALWQANLDANHPNVVALLAGRWEVTTLQIGGKWLHVGQPAFDAVLKRSLEEAVRVGTSTGALMVFMTAPCYSAGEQPNGQPWPEDAPARLDAYNAILRQVAAENPQRVDVLDLDKAVCPGGRFESTIDGIPVRESDGVHFVYLDSPASGRWLAAQVLPELVRVGRLQQAGKNLDGGRLAP